MIVLANGVLGHRSIIGEHCSAILLCGLVIRSRRRGPFFLSHAVHWGIRELHCRPVQVPCFCSACFSQCWSRRRFSADVAASSSLHLPLHRSCIGQP